MGFDVKRHLRRWAGYSGRRLLGTITHVQTTEPLAALTFDDGPHPVFTCRLLEVLARYDARATFFVVGEQAQKYPEIMASIAAAGHAIGNHSWNHPSFAKIGGGARRQQIRACAQATAPYASGLFRPPFGHQTWGSRLDAFWLGHQVVTWNISSAWDWLPNQDPGWMADQIRSRLVPGSIVLLHDALHNRGEEEPQYDRSPTIEAVDRLLARCGGEMQFVTVPDLLARGRPVRENWYKVR